VGNDLVGMTYGILFYDARHGKKTKGIKERKSGGKG
jgi:hypothetical protein